MHQVFGGGTSGGPGSFGALGERMRKHLVFIYVSARCVSLVVLFLISVHGGLGSNPTSYKHSDI